VDNLKLGQAAITIKRRDLSGYQEMQIPASTGTLGIQCDVSNTKSGIRAQIQDATGREIVVTDKSWECSSKNTGMKFDADESWKEASLLEVTQNKDLSINFKNKAKIIWSKDTNEKVVSCRRTLPQKPAGWLCNFK
jgi:hypothetical protein